MLWGKGPPCAPKCQASGSGGAQDLSRGGPLHTCWHLGPQVPFLRDVIHLVGDGKGAGWSGQSKAGPQGKNSPEEQREGRREGATGDGQQPQADSVREVWLCRVNGDKLPVRRGTDCGPSGEGREKRPHLHLAACLPSPLPSSRSGKLLQPPWTQDKTRPGLGDSSQALFPHLGPAF